jgi:dynein heavy chain
MWVIAMDIYSSLQEKSNQSVKKLNDAQATLERRIQTCRKAAALAEVESQLKVEMISYEESIASRNNWLKKMEETKQRLARASKLTLALGDERDQMDRKQWKD